MQLSHLKMIFVLAWICVAFSVAKATNVTSASAWIAVAVVALLPSLGAWFLWNEPALTLSESIRRQLR